MREQRVALEHVAEAPVLRRDVDPALAVEEHAAVHRDAPGVRLDQPRQALERQRLARARRPEQRDDGIAGLPGHVEREPGQALPDPDLDARAHAALAPSRPATNSTAHDSAVSSPTSTSASWLSPVCTAV